MVHPHCIFFPYLLTASFKERFQSLDQTLKQYKELNIKLQQDDKDMKEQQDKLDKEREEFDAERQKWQRHIEQARNDITEQNDRLTLLSQQLTGTQVTHSILQIHYNIDIIISTNWR